MLKEPLNQSEDQWVWIEIGNFLEYNPISVIALLGNPNIGWLFYLSFILQLYHKGIPAQSLLALIDLTGVLISISNSKLLGHLEYRM